jgi:SAM-dependent methyltransferase
LTVTLPNDIPSRFDDHYIYFDEIAKTAEQTDQETEVIVRLLGLTPGMDVLDCPCGYGRIANRLAARGCAVVGLDAVSSFLDRARADASTASIAVEYVLGDMRDLPWTGQFDRIVNWFVSFGYFDDATNLRILKEFRRALRPGGQLLIDYFNAASVLKLWARQQEVALLLDERDDDFRVTKWRYDVTSARVEISRVIVRGDVVVKRDESSIRVCLFPELRQWLLEAGFSRVDVFGDNGSPLSINSRQMIVVAYV